MSLHEDPIDQLARIERLAREAIDDATASLNLSPNQRLMGAEAKSRADFEAAVAGAHYQREPVWETGTVARLDADGITILVTYHPLRSWGYEFERTPGGLRGCFDSRYSCLLALAARRGVAS